MLMKQKGIKFSLESSSFRFLSASSSAYFCDNDMLVQRNTGHSSDAWECRVADCYRC